MMNNQDYWRERMLYAKKQRLISAAEYEDAMRSRLKDLEHEFEKEAAKFTQRYIDENNTTLEQASKVLNGVNNHRWSMSLKEFEAKAKAGGYERILNTEYYRSRIYRLQQLHDQMAELAKKYSVNEEIRMRNELIKTYDDTYLQDNYVKDVLEGQLTVKLNRFNEQQLADIVYRPWNGSNFSERIWNNYTKVLPDVLTDTMLRATVLGYSANRVVKDIRDRFYDVSTNNIHRLVVTEMGHAAEEATAKFYEDSDIEQYQYLATLETHTCDQCRHLDDKVFNTKDRVEGKNYPLMHPYCRCTTVPYIEGLPEAPTRWARDSTTGKGTWIDNLKFSEWKKIQGIKNISFPLYVETGAKYIPAKNAYEKQLNQEERRQLRFAESYYNYLRNSNRTIQINKIVKSSKVSKSIAKNALYHVLDSKYTLLDNNTFEYRKINFPPEPDMAHSLQRLIDGTPMKHDILLLKHENLEAKYMDDSNGPFYNDYWKAHHKANEKFDYQGECDKLRKLGILPDYKKGR